MSNRIGRWKLIGDFQSSSIGNAEMNFDDRINKMIIMNSKRPIVVIGGSYNRLEGVDESQQT